MLPEMHPHLRFASLAVFLYGLFLVHLNVADSYLLEFNGAFTKHHCN
jgi:hypothetical protein